MPTWVKAVLIAFVVGLLLLVVVGVAVGVGAVRFFDRQVEATERAAAEGRGYGFGVSLDRCTEEGVRRSSRCEGLTCTFQVHAFMWGCLENANYDDRYCASVAPVENDAATARWTAATCAQYGQPDNETCRVAMTVVPSFCSQAGAS